MNQNVNIWHLLTNNKFINFLKNHFILWTSLWSEFKGDVSMLQPWQCTTETVLNFALTIIDFISLTFKLTPELQGLGLTWVHCKWSANEMEILLVPFESHCASMLTCLKYLRAKNHFEMIPTSRVCKLFWESLSNNLVGYFGTLVYNTSWTSSKVLKAIKEEWMVNVNKPNLRNVRHCSTECFC